MAYLFAIPSAPFPQYTRPTGAADPMPPFRLLRSLLAALGLACATALFAQTPDPVEAPAPAPRRAPFIIPPDINGHRTIFPGPLLSESRPLSVAVYEGHGSAEGGIANVSNALRDFAEVKVTRLAPEDIVAETLSRFDIVAFTGGYSVNQAKSLGEAGKDAVRRYVAEGGRYLGICAGAYLAVVGEEWSLGLLNARLAPGNRWRGQTFLDLQLTPEGRSALAPVEDVFKVRYNNGPVIRPLNRPDMPPFVVLATFRSEIVRAGGQPGVMLDSPAIVMAPYGRGRVLAISPHPENTPGVENLIPLALRALVRPDPAP
jgi:glutamine amidotransferase-like uncharacterized protein